MAFEHAFTANRPDVPHWPSVQKTLTQADASAVVYPNGASAIVAKDTDWTAQQITQVQGVIDAAPTDTPQLEAQFNLDNISLFDKALVLTLLDQINVLRAKAGLTAVTPAQALQAIRDKAATL